MQADSEADSHPAAGAAPVHRGLADWQTRRLMARIDQHLDIKLRTVDLAAMLGLSVSHFSRAFKQTFGVPPRVYIVRRRIVAACAAMLTTDEPLTRIAHAHGFCDQSHFSRAFQLETGVAPQMWRRQHRPWARTCPTARAAEAAPTVSGDRPPRSNRIDSVPSKPVAMTA